MARNTTKAIPQETNGFIGLPITFSQFVKNPIVGTMFLGILLLFYLVYDMSSRIKTQDERIYALEKQISQASVIIAELKEANGMLKAELQTRKELKNIR
jgi:hypothetical protein